MIGPVLRRMQALPPITGSGEAEPLETIDAPFEPRGSVWQEQFPQTRLAAGTSSDLEELL